MVGDVPAPESLGKEIETAEIPSAIEVLGKIRDTPKIVDVQHRFYGEFFEIVDQIGFIDESERAMVQPIVVIHADAGEASLEASFALVRRWPKLRLVAVMNRGATNLGPRATNVLSEFPTTKRFVFGALDSVARICFEAVDFSLTDFLRTPPPEMSFVTHMALRVWTTTIFNQFRLFEIDVAMEGAQFL